MILATVHLSPSITVPLALTLCAAIVWYWIYLGRDDVPASRRKIRRFSLVVMLISMPMLVRALSFVDPLVDKRDYAVAWTAVTFMLLIVIAAAVMDAINNLRVHQDQRHDAIRQAASDLAQAIRERRLQDRGAGPRDAGAGAESAIDDRAPEAGA